VSKTKTPPRAAHVDVVRDRSGDLYSISICDDEGNVIRHIGCGTEDAAWAIAVGYAQAYGVPALLLRGEPGKFVEVMRWYESETPS